jgi:hypothetical protein
MIEGIFKIFIPDIINRYIVPDKLKNFNIDENNKIYLILIRYILLIIQMKYNDIIELHSPRNTTEYFTYTSDKMWSKIIYGMVYLNEVFQKKETVSYNVLFHYIHVGGCVNIIKYWYHHLREIKYTEIDAVKKDIKYHMQSTSYSISCDYNNINYLYDKIISQSLYGIRDFINLNNDNIYIYMLQFILNDNNIDNNLIIEYKKYLNNSYINSCRESENREDIINLIYDNM